MLFCCVSSVLADDSDLIIQQITINVPKAGTLSSKYGNSDKVKKLTNIKFTGELNLDDIKFIRELVGCNDDAEKAYDGHLQHLDLSEVTLKNEGEPFKANGNGSEPVCFDEDGSVNYMFAYSKELQSIVLPNQMEIIGNNAFCQCDNLQNVTLPSRLKKIKYYAFGWDKKIEALSLPSTLREIGKCAFAYSGIASIEIPSGVKNIETSTFRSCVNLSSVMLHKGLEKINSSAFNFCENLTSINIPEGVKGIDRWAFEGCI